MPSLRDLPLVLRRIGPWEMLKRIYRETAEDNLPIWAAALAYSWLFAVFPFFIFLLSLLPYLPWDLKERANSVLYDALFESNLLPEQAAQTLWVNLSDLLSRPRQSLLGLGILLALWAASGGMAVTMSAIERCYEVHGTRPIWKQRPIAVLLTIIVASLVIAVIVLLPVGTVVTRYLRDTRINLTWLVQISRWLLAASLGLPLLYFIWRFRGRLRGGWLATLAVGGMLAVILLLAFTPLHAVARDFFSRPHPVPAPLLWALNFSRFALALVFMFMVVAVVYYFGPGIKQHFRVLSPGAVFTIGVWILLGIGMRFYVNSFAYGSYNKTYGTVGGVVILLLLFYLDALVLLLGAEINSEIDFEASGVPRGSRNLRVGREPADAPGVDHA